MAHTRIKICGMTRPEDAALAAELGADAIGLNFVGGPRRIPAESAMEMDKILPTSVEMIALKFLDKNVMAPYTDEIMKKTGFIKLERRFNAVQLYGVTIDWIQEPQIPFMQHWVTENISRVWLPLPVHERTSLSRLNDRLSVIGRLAALGLRPGAIVLDTGSADKLGGTGRTFNWNWIAEARAAGELDGLPPIILAGGLNPDNVAEAIRIAQPYAVDVSSGVEVAGKPGVKDPIKMRDFIQAVR
jgi:phosphoribosylanthranilate isomerase